MNFMYKIGSLMDANKNLQDEVEKFKNLTLEYTARIYEGMEREKILQVEVEGLRDKLKNSGICEICKEQAILRVGILQTHLSNLLSAAKPITEYTNLSPDNELYVKICTLAVAVDKVKE